jgi:hypothetical protein
MAKTFKAALQDPLITFKWFERFLAIFCIAIPLILRLTDRLEKGGYKDSWRSSISDYVYMWHSYVFGLLLGMAAMLFIFNGFVYFKQEQQDQLNLDRSGKWYNIVLGTCLIGVVCFPWQQYRYIHFSFAGAFFLGNALVTGYFHTKRWRKSNVVMALLTVIALGLYFTGWFPWLTLFWAEWASLAVVGVHFWLESW